MKKILNNPTTYAEETIDGLCRAYPQYYKRVGSERVIARPDAPRKGKVGIVSGAAQDTCRSSLAMSDPVFWMP